VKACQDCRHVVKTEHGAVCMHPHTAAWFPDYFTGKERLEHPSIDVARTIGECGRDAALFEAAST